MVLDPVRNRVGILSAPPLPVCELRQAEESSADATGTSAKVRCRLVHPETKEPLLVSSQFLADMELFAVAATSNENGSFKPHMPNNDVICKQFSRGDILGEARRLTDVRFISDACLLYTSPSPRDKRQSRMPSSA